MIMWIHEMTLKTKSEVGSPGQLTKSFSYAHNQDRCRWIEMIMWIHETTLKTKSEVGSPGQWVSVRTV